MSSVLELKFGTLKGWSDLTAETVAALRHWESFGISGGAMTDRQTPEQIEALCRAIDTVDVVILESDGTEMTRDEAKEYVRKYRE